jgi:hypothetical protein
MVLSMPAFPCPYCNHALVVDEDARLEQCPRCAGSLLIAYRYRLVACHGAVSGGELYEALDDGFGERFAVVFVAEPNDPAAVARFIEGYRLFGDLGGRGLAKVHEACSHNAQRPYAVIDWLKGGTLEAVVGRRGPLEQAALIELVGTLLTGLGKAHRAMPAIVHGHIHPGKIGFRRGGEPVLFGFEWATQTRARVSSLADSFDRDEPEAAQLSPASDLRQLAVAFYYAATGEWLGDRSVAEQRGRVRAQLPGPLGRLIDRMLGAGLDGYATAVDAAMDFDSLLRGNDTWQSRPPQVREHSQDLHATAWSPGRDDADDDDDYEDDDEYEELDVHAHVGPAPAQVSPLASERAPAGGPAPDYAAWAAQRQAEALAAATSAQQQPSVSRVLPAIVAVTALAGVVFAVTVARVDDSPPPPPPIVFTPQPVEVPQLDLTDPLLGLEALEALEHRPEPAPAPGPAVVAGLFRYTGTITGPEAFAGLPLGTRCEIWVAPADSDRLNCRWYINCGDPALRIYGGGNVGYSTCEVEDGRPIRAHDEEDDAADGAFLADFSGPLPMLIFEDRWLVPPVRAIITIDEGGGLHPGPVPLPEDAPRVDGESIERLTAQGVLPQISAGKLVDWWDEVVEEEDDEDVE